MRPADRLAELLESCDAHSPSREYKGVAVNHDTVGVLLDVASSDLPVIQEAARLYLSGASSGLTLNMNRRSFTNSGMFIDQ